MDTSQRRGRRGRDDRTVRRRRVVALAALLSSAAVAWTIVSLAAGPDTRGARVMHYTIASRLLHRSLEQVGVSAATAGRLPALLVFLHGMGQDQESSLDAQFYSAISRLGPSAPDVVFPYGGDDSYWHDRANGAWASYVVSEVIPQAIRRLHADPNRVAIGGLSMGGFGAYDIARRYPGKFCAVGGDSAALWFSGGETAAGAFDDGEDFERHDVLRAARTVASLYRGVPLWLDVGSADPFRGADEALARELAARGERVQFHVWPGGHDDAYWSSHWESYLHFYANALSKCR